MEKNVLISQSRKAIGSQELRIRMLAIGFKPLQTGIKGKELCVPEANEIGNNMVRYECLCDSMCIHIVKSIGRFLEKKVVPTHSKRLGLLNTIDLRGRTSVHFTIYKRSILFKYQSDFAHTSAGVKKGFLAFQPLIHTQVPRPNARGQFRANGHIFGTSHHKILCLATVGGLAAMALSVLFKFTVWWTLKTKCQEESKSSYL